MQKDHIKILEVFDVGELVKLNCGEKVGDHIQFFKGEGEYEEYGVEKCKKFMKCVPKI